MIIYQHGMRRSGNCLCKELLERNYACRVKRYANHMTIPRPAQQTVVAVRHPLSWLPSLYRMQRRNDWIHPEMSFREWSEGDWMQSEVPRDRWTSRPGDGTRTRWESRRGFCPRIPDWNRTYAYWLRSGARIVQYENLVLTTRECIAELAEDMGLERGGEGPIEVPGEYVSPHKRSGGRAGCVRRLRQRTYLRKWSEEAFGKLQHTVDHSILDEFGYDLDVDLPLEDPEPVGD